MKKTIIRIAGCIVFAGYALFSASAQAGDSFSLNTLSSVVKLSSIVARYEVEGLPDDYTFRLKGGDPDFGDARVLREQVRVEHVGTGVIVSESGLIISNAHVTQAYSEPTIVVERGMNNRERIGSDGKPVKIVTYNLNPRFMAVGVAEKGRLEKNDDAQKLSYLAYVVTDDKDYDTYRDRAVLQIFYRCHETDSGFPALDGRVDDDFSVPAAELGNPFRTSPIDRRVRAIGFPGTGDPNRAARTAGELLGYEDEDSSVLLHTSYISGGNSGGGLFCADKLIGINTWDKREITSRPVGAAQPITYWYDMLAKVAWLYPSIDLPDIDLKALADDPSTDDYKDMAQVAFRLVAASNKNVPITEGTLYVHRTDATIEDILQYLAVRKQILSGWTAAQLLWVYPLDEVLEMTGLSRTMLEGLQGVNSLSDMRSLIAEGARPYFDEMMRPDFYYTRDTLDEDGKVMLSVPKNCKVSVTYMSPNGNYRSFTLDVDDEYLQGAYTVPVE